jgi:predicted lysophospholipase L1 biosynthesis ABC-type transport system permease subunit
MPDTQFSDQRERRQLREESRWNIQIACITAWVTSAAAVVLIGYIAADTGEWTVFATAVAGACVMAGLGWCMWTYQSRAAAWGLGVLAAGNLVFRVVYTESLGGVVFGILVCLAYYRGWRGTETLHELRRNDDTTVRDVSK